MLKHLGKLGREQNRDDEGTSDCANIHWRSHQLLSIGCAFLFELKCTLSPTANKCTRTDIMCICLKSFF